MTTRKIQQVGGGTYTVSVPKEWAEAADLAAGDEVTVRTHLDETLVVQAQQHDDASEQVVIPVAVEEPVALERLVRTVYAGGVPNVRLEATETFTTAQRHRVRRVSSTLTGMTVVDESDASITLRTLLDAEEVSIRQSVRQLQFVAVSMHRDATGAVTGDAQPEGLAGRDDQADRLYALIDRHVTRGLERLDEMNALGMTRPELFELWVTAHELEQVANHAEEISALTTTLDAAVDDETAANIRDVARTARDIVVDAVHVVVGDATAVTARQALTAREKVGDEITTVERRLFEAADSDYRLVQILDRIRRTAERGGTIAEVGLRAASRRGELSEAWAVTDTDDDCGPAVSVSPGIDS